MNQPIKVLHLSTHDEECGIAVFQQNVVDSMGKDHAIHNEFFPVSPNKLKALRGAELEAVLADLFAKLDGFDILHIQHEYSFYQIDQLQRIVDGAKSRNKKILFTLHTPPHARKEHLTTSPTLTLNPHSWINARRLRIAHQTFLSTFINPLYSADLLIVLSQASKESFEAYGLPDEKIKVIEMPIPATDVGLKTNEISKKLHKKHGDVILSTVGFIAEPKGTIPVVKALTFLPSNYKLAIIGGSHPSGQNDRFYDEVCDLIRDLNLKDRVYITGYIEEAARRDALARETDICLYPYDKKYYDYVSSAALANAIANYLPIVAYKTRTFEEINQIVPFINFCHSPNYYELARVVQEVDLKESAQLTQKYAELFTVEKQAKLFAEQYQKLMDSD